MNSICFFNDGHNGDIIHSKSFIEDISRQLDVPCLYHHKKNFKLTQDLSIPTTQIAPSPHKENHEKFIETKNILFVSTWMYPYLMDPEFNVNGINIDINYKAYAHMCKKINSIFNVNIKLKNINNYLPYINFNFVEKENIDKFVFNDKNKKILICNGPCLSGQTKFNENMSDLINELAFKYKNITFIATEKFDCSLNNVKFTSDIIKIKTCDLNEIGYLSTFCDFIIGRNSGPFCFCTLKENLLNKNKIFYAFGHNEKDCFHYGSNITAKFIFNNSEDKENIFMSIEKEIIDKLV